MSILIDENTRILVQGITGHEGLFHAQKMLEYHSQVVAGVTPGRGGQTVLDGICVYNTVREAVDATHADTSIIFVPPRMALDAILESVAGGIKLVVVITEGIPTLDMVTAVREAKLAGVRIVGPNCPGLISPGKSKCGIMPADIHRRGTIGVVSRSGTLTYEVVNALTQSGFGQSTCIGIGGDPVIGSNFVEILELFENDPETEGVALLGEIGGSDEEDAAAFYAAHMTKPMAAFIAGRTAPAGRRMGHAGAIIDGGHGTAENKIRVFESVGVPVASFPDELPGLLAKKLQSK